MQEPERRQMPHDEAAEQSVLGGVLLRPGLLPGLELQAEQFFNPRNQSVFQAMRTLQSQERPIDEVSLSAVLQDEGKFEAVGGFARLAQIGNRVPIPDNVHFYAERVRSLHGKRLLLLAASEIETRAYEPTIALGELAGFAMAELRKALQDGASQRKAEPIGDGLKRLARRLERDEVESAVPTGFNELDHRLGGGLRGGELCVLAGRPGMGKSALGALAALQAAERGHPALVFALEMSTDQVVERFVGARSEVSPAKLRSRSLGRDDMRALVQTWSSLGQLPVAIDDTPALSIGELQARAWRFVAEQDSSKRGIIVVDYLQLMRGTEYSRRQNREREVGEISTGLRELAKQLGWPVIALSQLNRNLESRSDKRPMLSDLRESGALEQDADVVWMLYRDEYYHPDSTEHPGIAELNVAKWRHGSTGVVKLRFDAHLTRFRDLNLVERNTF